MADGYGAIQYGAWRLHLAAWVIAYTDTTDTIRVETRFQSVNNWYHSGMNCSVSLNCNGQKDSWSGTASTSTNGEATIRRYDFVVAKADTDRNVSVSASMTTTGYQAGTSSASCQVFTGAKTCRKPDAPKNVSVATSGDTQINMSWQSAANAGAFKPWANVMVDIQTCDGAGSQNGWGHLTTLSGSATSHSFTGLSANHRYYLAVYSKNRAGESDHVNLGWVQMTPAAPTISATKTGDTSVKVSVKGTTRWTNTTDIYRSANGGGWTLVAGGLSAPDVEWTDNSAPGGTVRYMARQYAIKYTWIGWSGGSVHSSDAATGSITTTLTPDPPKNVTFTRESDSAISVSWQSAANAGASKPWSQIILA